MQMPFFSVYPEPINTFMHILLIATSGVVQCTTHITDLVTPSPCTVIGYPSHLLSLILNVLTFRIPDTTKDGKKHASHRTLAKV